MVNGEVLDDAGATTLAVFLAFLYDHADGPEVFVDLVLGPWDEDADPRERLTFSTRTGRVVGGSIACTLIDAGSVAPDDPRLGTRVSREEGLLRPEITTVWSYLDSVLADVPVVRDHLARAGRSARPRWPWRRR
jgi:hypothetical protein